MRLLGACLTTACSRCPYARAMTYRRSFIDPLLVTSRQAPAVQLFCLLLMMTEDGRHIDRFVCPIEQTVFSIVRHSRRLERALECAPIAQGSKHGVVELTKITEWEFN